MERISIRLKSKTQTIEMPNGAVKVASAKPVVNSVRTMGCRMCIVETFI